MRSSCCLCVSGSPLSTFESLIQSLWNLVCISRHLSPSQWHTWRIPPNSLCVCMCIPLSFLGNGSVNMVSQQWVHTIELLEASFSIWSMSDWRESMESLCVCVSKIVVNIPLKCWSEGSQSCQTVNMAMSPMWCWTKNHCADRGQ
jgi:hypothetical protein